MHIINLTHPIVSSSGLVNSVTLRRPTVADLIATDTQPTSGDIESTAIMLSQLSGLPREVVDRIDIEDFSTLSMLVADLLIKQTAKPEA